MRHVYNNSKKLRFLAKLFWLTFKLSSCTFGGGYVIVPLMKNSFVEEHHWITEEEMLNLVALSQSAPGPIAVNASVMLGFQVAGFWGAMASTLGTVLPPLCILSLVSLFYSALQTSALFRAVLIGMHAAVAAIICDAVIRLSYSTIKQSPNRLVTLGLMLTVIALVLFTSIGVVWIIGLAILFGTLYAIAIHFIKKNRGEIL